MKAIRDAATQILRRWRRQKVITLAELREGLQASIRTVRRRLQSWKALASFNHNSRFYTLPELPQFDPHGLWFYGDIGFSRHGHLPQTIVALVRQSPGGLTAAQLGQRLQLRLRRRGLGRPGTLLGGATRAADYPPVGPWPGSLER